MKIFLEITILLLIVTVGFSLVIFTIGHLIGKAILSSVQDSANCWEESLEGYHEATGRKAYLTINFDCEEFEFKGQRVLEEQQKLENVR